MRNKTSKIILLIFISIAIVILLIPKKQNLKKIAWRNVNGFEILIKGDLDEIEEFYTSIEKRLAGYADWIDIILTGRYSKFQKDYAPFSDSRVTFEKYYPIYMATDMVGLLLEYSNYLEELLFKGEEWDIEIVDVEMSRLFQFVTMINQIFTNNIYMQVDNTIDLMHFGINRHYDPINKIYSVYVFLNDSKNVNNQLDQIKAQIEIEVSALSQDIDVDVIVNDCEFETANLSDTELIKNYQNFNSADYRHIYKYLPLITLVEFNSRKLLMKQNIHHEILKSNQMANEFRIILSKIEEQLIEFQFRFTFENNNSTSRYINELVGDSKSEIGILTETIDFIDDEKYLFKVKDYLLRNNKYLLKKVNNNQQLPFPSKNSLPIKLSKIYVHDDKMLVIKIN